MSRASLFAALLVLGASAEPYWVAYEGDDLPENQGWTRMWGNQNGEFHGEGAHRTIQNGLITYDSLYDPWVYDINIMERPGAIDPEPGETFVMEWRLRVDQVDGYADPGIVVNSDDAWSLAYVFSEDEVISLSEHLLRIPVAPGVFHSYRVVSNDMRSYELYVDDLLVHEGRFDHIVSRSQFGWGDMGKPVAGLHDWDYVRLGVVPEPAGIVCLLAALASRRGMG